MNIKPFFLTESLKQTKNPNSLGFALGHDYGINT